jgi:hypothetical protein
MIVVEPSHALSTAKLHVFSQNRKKIPMSIVLETNKKQLEQNRTKDRCLRRNQRGPLLRGGGVGGGSDDNKGSLREI